MKFLTISGKGQPKWFLRFFGIAWFDDGDAKECSPADCNINTRQPIPRQKRFRTKGGRSDGALRIGNLLIASKVP